ncbi:imidazolonepropionase [Rubricoccus marinus]|uniref:Imidazolonepropionase n=1 Tax=Rubricoccus marinus TaxID=716817 RepID=A0A259TYF2_9BACT|nr:imidazolonepropionase [Rubricoccus marinus]OZC02805.1 imidazolonepropionase [Rubricoccus marinus]
MPVLTDVKRLYTCPPEARADDVGEIESAAMVWREGRVEWVGREQDLPVAYADEPEVSAAGLTVVPGLVDCHTHLAFGGARADEFTERLNGTSYLDIAARGGGILSTVRATREASEELLQVNADLLLCRMLRRGVTTVEAKSGYGLSLADELKQLRVYKRLAQTSRQRLIPTLLAAHAVPPEFSGNRDGYLDLICNEILPAVAAERLAVFCDAFVETGAFTPDEARRVFAAARGLGLVPKLHADQLSDTGGGALAAEVGAASADHLENISEASIRAMARAGTVAVSLPLATLVLGVEPLPARELMEAGVPVAVATDFNPGSAPVADLPLAMWAACVRQRMTPAQVLRGATTVAARALQLHGSVGSLLPGYHADFVLINSSSVETWMYSFDPDAIWYAYIGGEVAYDWSA